MEELKAQVSPSEETKPEISSSEEAEEEPSPAAESTEEVPAEETGAVTDVETAEADSSAAEESANP